MKLPEYQPSDYASKVLKDARILALGETPQQMFERVVNTLFDVEVGFNTPSDEAAEAKETFAEFVAGKYYTPGTPTLNNAGRAEYQDAALSSCAIIPVDLRQKEETATKIRAYYRQNMGSGFDFTPYADPVELLIWLNDLSAQETATGKYDRYIGNMGNLHISHPKIREFIRAKRETDLKHFNLSIDVDDRFMSAAVNSESFELTDGTVVNARDLLMQIAESNWQNGDPSIINLERMNRHNPLVDLNPYTTTPPCAEMGMTRGETCQFAYVNISKFATPNGIDLKLLARATRSVTRAMDNAVEISLGKYPDPLSTEVARFKRKIGIGMSGIADTLMYFGIPYDTEEARLLVRDTASFMNYNSKLMSVELAEKRGPCEAMSDRTHNKYYGTYLEDRYGQGSGTVTPESWYELAEYIRKTGNLRNILTTTLPPAARVSILMSASFGIEPIFGIPTSSEKIPDTIKRFVRIRAGDRASAILEQAAREGTFQNITLPQKECLKTAKEISYRDHLLMVAGLVGNNGVVDEVASKTVNLPSNATPEDIFGVFVMAHELGLKNIAVYRDGSIQEQPHKL